MFTPGIRRVVSSRCPSRLRVSYHSWYFPEPPRPPSEEQIQAEGLPVLHKAVQHANRRFVSEWIQSTKDEEEDLTLSYGTVIDKSVAVANYIQGQLPSASPFVAHSTVPGSEYIACLWGSFSASKASVPISITHKVPEIEHVLQDSDPSIIFVSKRAPNYDQVLEAAANLKLSERVVSLEDVLPDASEAPGDPMALLEHSKSQSFETPAMLMYTSGTTGKPKGVLHTHRNMYHQVTDLVAAWEWQPGDVAMHVLPLHHVHGFNVLSCAAYVGAQLQFRPFDAHNMWQQWAETPTKQRPRPTVFMAVPTIYAKLLEAARHLKSVEDPILQEAVRHTLHPMRLQVSGSAALPTSVLEEWRQLTGHTLLERYGMTEFAMALSNPYNEVAAPRRPGHVGMPLPSVECRLVQQGTSDGDEVVVKESDTPGELQIKGPGVFVEYWNRPDATEESFTKDGFFRTGDVAQYQEQDESYRILGRASVDILKVGGHKLSALEIERELLEHPDVLEVVIVGAPDDVWGERVAMVGRAESSNDSDNGDTTAPPSLEELQEWCENRLAKHKIPTRLLWLDDIPKNAMGKVNKKELVKLFD